MMGLDGGNYNNLDQDGRKRADNLKILFDMLVPSPAQAEGGNRAAQPMNVNDIMKDDKSMQEPFEEEKKGDGGMQIDSGNQINSNA